MVVPHCIMNEDREVNTRKELFLSLSVYHTYSQTLIQSYCFAMDGIVFCTCTLLCLFMFLN